MARLRRQQADLVPAELLTFDQHEWERDVDDGRWQPAFRRWTDARAAFMAAHPDSMALGNALERLRTEFQAQHTPQHYPPDATTWQ